MVWCLCVGSGFLSDWRLLSFWPLAGWCGLERSGRGEGRVLWRGPLWRGHGLLARWHVGSRSLACSLVFLLCGVAGVLCGGPGFADVGVGLGGALLRLPPLRRWLCWFFSLLFSSAEVFQSWAAGWFWPPFGGDGPGACCLPAVREAGACVCGLPGRLYLALCLCCAPVLAPLAMVGLQRVLVAVAVRVLSAWTRGWLCFGLAACYGLVAWLLILVVGSSHMQAPLSLLLLL